MLKKNKQINKKKNNVAFNLIEVIVIILMTSLVVGVSTGIIVYQNYNEIDAKTTKDDTKSYLNEIETTYKNILKGYVNDIDEKELTNAAIKGMYDYLGDPYTSYLDEDTANNLTDRLNGEYKGIGVEIQKVEGGTLIVNVFESSPADTAGLLPGDLIIKIDGNDVTSKSASEVSKMIKEKEGYMKVTVKRSSIEKTVEVKSKTINIPSVTKNNYDGVGYISISTFSNTTFTQFKDALESLEKDGIKSLVIDVRDNGGGYLASAVDIAELFIEKGKNIYGLESKGNKTMYKDETADKRDYKIAVLINNNTASASEILAAALKESYGATLVGTKSYGKGTVQEKNELSTGGMVKYTTGYWLTPNENSINEVGLTPDIEVTKTTSDETDIELEKAITVVK